MTVSTDHAPGRRSHAPRALRSTRPSPAPSSSAPCAWCRCGSTTPDGVVRRRRAPPRGPRVPHRAAAARSSPGSAATPRSASARPTWPATGRAGEGTDLADLLTPFAARLTTLVPQPLQRLRGRRGPADPAAPREHPGGLARQHRGALRPAATSCSQAFLDPTLTYSSAWFDDDADVTTAADLEGAQLRKIDGILDYAGVRRGHPGAGDRHRLGRPGRSAPPSAARASPRVTLSSEQLAPRPPARRGGRASRTGSTCGCRTTARSTGEFDAIVSVEMIEAVGEEYWPTYFATIDRLLAPGGRVAIQAITMAHDRMLATRRTYGWIQKYIFPGGLIPSLRGHRPDARRPHHAAGQPAPRARPALRPHAARCGGSGSSRTGRRSTPRASTRRSAGCGSSTSPTARPASAPATSASASCS